MIASLLGVVVKSFPDSSMSMTMFWYSSVLAVSFLRSIRFWTWFLSTGAYVSFDDLIRRETISAWRSASVSPLIFGWLISWTMSMSCVASVFSSSFSYLGMMYSQYGSAREVSVVIVVRIVCPFCLGLSISC